MKVQSVTGSAGDGLYHLEGKMSRTFLRYGGFKKPLIEADRILFVVYVLTFILRRDLFLFNLTFIYCYLNY